MNTVAMLVTDAEKANVEAAIADLTPEHSIGFIRKVVPISPTPTWETPHTHWYMNDENVPDDVVQAWVAAVPSMTGLMAFFGVNIDNSLSWAHSNMGSQGLMFQPDPPS
jgi:hypothetical protein